MNTTAISFPRILNASLLIAGTCIGGGMLALPIATSPLGFFPTLLAMLICCILMTITGFLYLEATLWMKENAHMNTLSNTLLAPFWKFVCWATYLFICYASLVAYTSGGGKEVSFVLNEFLNFPKDDLLGMIFFLAFFGIVLALGNQLVQRVNTAMFFSMIFAYIMLISTSGHKINPEFIARQEWNSHFIFAFPLMLTTFSFPGIVPTIVPYLDRNPNAIKSAILLGTTITFIVYFLWLLIVFGSVPHLGEHSLTAALQCNLPATECLHYALQNPYISITAQFFAFFALSTSFIGISLSLFDFLGDSFPQSINPAVKKIMFCLMILVPSFMFALWFERAFITALELSGGIGDAIISGIIPALMVWNGRYLLSKKGAYQVPGGKPLLFGVMLMSLMIFFFELYRRVLP